MQLLQHDINFTVLELFKLIINTYHNNMNNSDLQANQVFNLLKINKNTLFPKT